MAKCAMSDCSGFLHVNGFVPHVILVAADSRMYPVPIAAFRVDVADVWQTQAIAPTDVHLQFLINKLIHRMKLALAPQE